MSPKERMGEQIAALAARIDAATYELLVLIREFDEKEGWNNGFLSWLFRVDGGDAVVSSDT